MHELERERIMRLFSKQSDFCTDGSTLEEDLTEKRKEESEHLIEVVYRGSYTDHVPYVIEYSVSHFLYLIVQREN